MVTSLTTLSEACQSGESSQYSVGLSAPLRGYQLSIHKVSHEAICRFGML